MQQVELNQDYESRLEERQPEFTTKNEWVYTRLRADILCGALSPGQRLVVSRLAKQCNVSPMPVRDALHRLAQDGFVEMTPHAGATVVSFSDTQLREIIFIRMDLEVLAACQAVPLMTEEGFAYLENMHQRMVTCAEESDRIRYEALNWDFHDYIYARCGNTTLYDMVMMLWRKSCITRTALIRIPAKLHNSVAGHRKWLDAMRAGDVEMVRATVLAHVKDTMDRIEQFAEPGRHMMGLSGNAFASAAHTAVNPFALR